MRGSRPRQQRRQWQWRPGFLPAASQSLRVHVVWNRKTEKRDTGSEGSGAEPVTAYPCSPFLPLRPGLWAARYQPAPLLAFAGSGRCPCRATIGPVKLGGAWVALPLVRAGVGRCPGPGNSARREEPGGAACER